MLTPDLPPESSGNFSSDRPPMTDIDARRRALGLSARLLAAEANMSERQYSNLLAGRCTARASTLSRLRAALDRLSRRARTREGASVVSLYRLALSIVCQADGLDVADVDAHPATKRATQDAAWLRAALLRRRAVYLASAVAGLSQAQAARAAGMTPAAASLAVRAIEEARDTDPDLDALCTRLARDLTGALF